MKGANKSVKMRKKQVECESGDNQLEKGYVQKYIKEKEKRKQAEKTEENKIRMEKRRKITGKK